MFPSGMGSTRDQKRAELSEQFAAWINISSHISLISITVFVRHFLLTFIFHTFLYNIYFQVAMTKGDMTVPPGYHLQGIIRL